MIKKFCLGLSILWTLMACEEIIDVEVPTTAPRLVIDAQFYKFTRTENPRSEGIVKLSLSAPFFDQEIPPALGATVTITDPVHGLVFYFTDSQNNGQYFANFVPEFNIPYTLEISYNNERYIATEYLIPTAIIEEVIQGDGELFAPDDREIKITIKDDPEQQNFYYFNLDMGNYLTSDDEFYNGNSFPFSYFYENLVIGDVLNIQVFGADETFNNFLDILLLQSGEAVGSPFSTTPATAKGNVINTTNPQHYPFGYFQISEGYEKTVEITE